MQMTTPINNCLHFTKRNIYKNKAASITGVYDINKVTGVSLLDMLILSPVTLPDRVDIITVDCHQFL